MVALSVLVATSNPGSALPDLVRSIDAQTLPATAFELIVVDDSSDGSAERLQQLAGRRPNVTVLTAAAGSAVADRVGRAFERATGEYVVVVAQQQLLAPRALELLLDRAGSAGADVVLGRVVAASASGSAVLPDDADRMDATEIDPTLCLALVRRALPADLPDPGAALLDLPALAGGAGLVSALGRYACATRHGGPTVPGETVSVQSPTYRWSEGMLHLTVPVRISEPTPPADRSWLIATRGLAEIALPAALEPDERDGTTLIASAVLDPRTANGGHPLDDGPWDLRLRLGRPAGEVTVPLTTGPARSAVIAGRPYVVRAGDPTVQLDAGATETSVIGRVRESQASLVESGHGTVVTLEHPELHVHGDAVLDARLLLGGFGLPARLVCRDGRARLEAFASALAGVSAVAVVAGGGRPVQTGLRLRVDGTGGMAFEAVPPAAPRPRPEPAPAATGPAPLVQRLRRRLPGALEPVVHRLARMPVLRRTYRLLISR